MVFTLTANSQNPIGTFIACLFDCDVDDDNGYTRTLRPQTHTISLAYRQHIIKWIQQEAHKKKILQNPRGNHPPPPPRRNRCTCFIRAYSQLFKLYTSCKVRCAAGCAARLRCCYYWVGGRSASSTRTNNTAFPTSSLLLRPTPPRRRRHIRS